MGVCTFVPSKVYIIGDRKEVIGVLTMSSSYATGGDTALPALFGLDLELNIVELPNDVTNGTLSFRAVWDNVNNKIKLFGNNATPGAAVADPEVTNATNVAAYTGIVRAVGKGSAA
jgi:hypothetical protein